VDRTPSAAPLLSKDISLVDAHRSKLHTCLALVWVCVVIMRLSCVKCCYYASTLRQVELLVAPFVECTLLTLTLSEVPILQ
jgi:hypothetical protein